MQAAIDAAGAAGGGVVKLGLGRWYLDGPLLLPDSVALTIKVPNTARVTPWCGGGASSTLA